MAGISQLAIKTSRDQSEKVGAKLFVGIYTEAGDYLSSLLVLEECYGGREM